MLDFSKGVISIRSLPYDLQLGVAVEAQVESLPDNRVVIRNQKPDFLFVFDAHEQDQNSGITRDVICTSDAPTGKSISS